MIDIPKILVLNSIRYVSMTFSVKNLRYNVIFQYTETYDMAISSILLHYNTKTGFLKVLHELNSAEISPKQLRSCRYNSLQS